MKPKIRLIIRELGRINDRPGYSIVSKMDSDLINEIAELIARKHTKIVKNEY